MEKITNGWTKRLEATTRKYIAQNPKTTGPSSYSDTWGRQDEETVYTDGSVKKGLAALGIFFNDQDSRNRGMVCDGIQEINNAEIKAVILALKVCTGFKKVTIVSDSLNTVRFASSAESTPDRIIRGW